MDEAVDVPQDRVSVQAPVQNKLQSIWLKVLSRRFFKAIALGQCLSLLLCGTAVSTGLLQEQGINMPTAQMFSIYILLCVVFGSILLCRRGEYRPVERFKQWWWRYFLIAVVDVEANFLVVKAYAYTTVTSVQMLDCFSILTVMVLSWVFLHMRYRLANFLGAGICLLGMTGLVLTDVLIGAHGNEQGSNVALGDVLVIVGACLYGISNTCEEYVVRRYDKVEFLAYVGFFASFINGAQLWILERKELESLDLTSYKTVVPLVVFIICAFLLYATMTLVIQLTSATTVNLSLLSADFYTLLFGLFLFNYKFHFLYFISFVVILMGLLVYSLMPALSADHGATGDGDPMTDEPQTNHTAASGASGASGASDTNDLMSDRNVHTDYQLCNTFDGQDIQTPIFKFQATRTVVGDHKNNSEPVLLSHAQVKHFNSVNLTGLQTL